MVDLPLPQTAHIPANTIGQVVPTTLREDITRSAQRMNFHYDYIGVIPVRLIDINNSSC
jgi:hypothetical protein